MFRTLKAWWRLLELGSARRVASQVMEHFRYSIQKVLADDGLYEYLQEPRAYGEVLAELGYKDSNYTRELFELLVTEKQNTLIKQNGMYQANPKIKPPTLEELFSSTDRQNHSFVLLSESLAQNILFRLRNQPIEYTTAFEEQSREMMQTFDTVLGNQLYTVSRKVALALLTKEDWADMSGKHLLDIGCGAGRETAELWLHFNGAIQITGIDPVATMIERAETDFDSLLDEIDPNHPPVNGKRPMFQEASATALPFGDNSFDAAFHSHVLHWTYDPRKAMDEVVRVVKPGGLIFGVQTCKPYTAAYTDMLWRSNENFFGFFWKEEFIRWYGERGVEIEYATPAGAFRGRLTE